MQLSPLQSRLAASVIATCLVLVIYFLLLPPQFALAADLSYVPQDHDTDRWATDGYDVDDTAEPLDLQSPAYEPEFSFFDRSIIGRQTEDTVTLSNNKPVRMTISPGSTMNYVFPASSVSGRGVEALNKSPELRRRLNGTTAAVDEGGDEIESGDEAELGRRQSTTTTTTLWISANTCQQPDRTQTTMDPPQLTMFVSTSSDTEESSPKETLLFEEGAVMYKMSLSSDVSISIAAPPDVDSSMFNDKPYDFELVVSTDEYYHSYNTGSDPEVFLVDSDANSVLMTTRNLTNSSSEVISTPPYVMFAQGPDDLSINGLRNSYCGLSSYAQLRMLDDGTGQIRIGLKQGGASNLTRQEFYITGLSASTKYDGILARVPGSNSQSKRADGGGGGGPVVFRQTVVETKPDGACTVIHNLTLCSDTEYAVPGNISKFKTGTELAAFYDNYTQTMYSNFEKVLQQVPCEAPDTERYSLVRNCDDCKTAYKNWLCTVAIPRCEDFSAPDKEYLQMRNINAPFPNNSQVPEEIRANYSQVMAFNSSRNSIIDEQVQPGPYKELLPCDDLCYSLVQSCPASLGFNCPTPSTVFGFNTSYGRRKDDDPLSCNYPGSADIPNQANAMAISQALLVLVVGSIFAFAL
ncbi:stretch-activated Ca2+-permeable channel component-domain-containing protein [Xylariomycetidae sp. FL2044]|nr:stretch-activated Ca2+-permeable channel component-domain-containing protein [Xylariomycetidae sp. FL2044]